MNSKVRLLISAGLLGLVVWQTDWMQVQQAFAQLRLELWLGAIVVLLLLQFFSAVRWQALARPLGLHRPLLHMVGFYFIGAYFNLLLPTSVGGDVVRAWYLDGQSGKKLLAFLSSFLDRLCGLYVLLAVACVGVLISPQELPNWMMASVWSLAAGGLISLAALPVLLRYRDKAPGRLGRILTALHSLPSLRILAWPVVLSVVVQVGNVVLVWMIGEAIDAPVPMTFYWVLVPLVSLLTLLPISVNGMGVREGAMTVLLASVGVGQGTALTLSFLWFAVTAAVSLAGGLVYMFGRFPRPQLATAATEEVEKQDGPFCCHSDQGRTGQPKTAA